MVKLDGILELNVLCAIEVFLSEEVGEVDDVRRKKREIDDGCRSARSCCRCLDGMGYMPIRPGRCSVQGVAPSAVQPFGACASYDTATQKSPSTSFKFVGERLHGLDRASSYGVGHPAGDKEQSRLRITAAENAHQTACTHLFFSCAEADLGCMSTSLEHHLLMI